MFLKSERNEITKIFFHSIFTLSPPPYGTGADGLTQDPKNWGIRERREGKNGRWPHFF